MTSGRMISLEKQPGIRPVGVEETWIRLMTKCLLRVMGKEANYACRKYQLSGGVYEGIEGRIHAMPALWEEHSQEEDWGFLLIDTRNSLNGENWADML